MDSKYEGDNRIKQLTPGIQRNNELKNLDALQSELKNEELFFRAQHK